MGCTTDARHRNTSVDRGTNTGVEEICLKEDLAIGNRNHVGWNKRRNVARLRFDDRQRGERARLAFNRTLGEFLDVVFVHTSSALKQTAVQIKHVAGERLAARRTAQQQGNLTIRNGLFRQIVVNDQRIFAAIAEIFAHRATSVRRQVLHRWRIRRRRCNDDGVGHRAFFFELLDQCDDGRCLLADSDINADEVFALLVDDGVDGDSSLAGLAITNDQLALTATDWHHRVD